MSTPTHTPQRAPLLSTAEALATLLAAAVPIVETESVATLDALGRVLAADVVSSLDVPPTHMSAMDGYAVRVADLLHGERRLPISQRIPAGHAPQPLAAGTAARIFTGAPVPAGADAVVMQEQTEADGEAVAILHTPKAGEWITAQGADIRRGSVILPSGTRRRERRRADVVLRRLDGRGPRSCLGRRRSVTATSRPPRFDAD